MTSDRLAALRAELDERLRALGHRHDPAEVAAAADLDPDELLADRLRRLSPAWHREAACRGADLQLFFPARGARVDEPLAICGRCTVRRQCLDEALADPALDHGIRGGATPAARKLMRRNRQRAATNTTDRSA